MNTYRGVIFDLDGTLLDTVVDLGHAVNAVLHKYSFQEHDTSFYRSIIGQGLKTFITKALPPEAITDGKLEVYWEETRNMYAKKWREHTKMFDGISDILTQLNSARIPLAIVTNKNDDDTHDVVKELLAPYTFSWIHGLKPGGLEKPDPGGVFEAIDHLGIQKDQVIYVGDQSIDMQTAMNAGIFALWAGWGYEKPTPSEGYSYKIIEHPSEILPFIAN